MFVAGVVRAAVSGEEGDVVPAVCREEVVLVLCGEEERASESDNAITIKKVRNMFKLADAE